MNSNQQTEQSPSSNNKQKKEPFHKKQLKIKLLRREKSFSVSRVLIFVLFLGLIGSYAVWRLATPPSLASAITDYKSSDTTPTLNTCQAPKNASWTTDDVPPTSSKQLAYCDADASPVINERVVLDGFNLSATSGTNSGIVVHLNDVSTLPANPSGVQAFEVRLSWNGGTSWTGACTTGDITTGSFDGAEYYCANVGTAAISDTLSGTGWGRTWSASELSPTNFRVEVKAVNTSTSSVAQRFDIVRVKIFDLLYHSYRDTPISPAGYLGGINMTSNAYVLGFRFVLDKPISIDRWYFSINGEGADCETGARLGYGFGDGGTHYGRIVEVDQLTGLPTNSVIASETVNACEAYLRAKSEFNLPALHQAHWVQFSPVALEAQRMYAFLLSNTHPEPGTGGRESSGNHMTANTNFVLPSQMGPHEQNTLSATTPGALYGLDPRETTFWSSDSGQTWKFGVDVGWYDRTKGKMWTAGYRIAGGLNIGHGWPYHNWPGEGPATVTFTDLPKDVVLTHAGGANSDGTDVGVITVKNLTTGATTMTSVALGPGIGESVLSSPITVMRGESYSVSSSGSVDTGSAGNMGTIFQLGTRQPYVYSSECANCINLPRNRPMLYASPHPYYGQ